MAEDEFDIEVELSEAEPGAADAAEEPGAQATAGSSLQNGGAGAPAAQSAPVDAMDSMAGDEENFLSGLGDDDDDYVPPQQQQQQQQRQQQQQQQQQQRQQQQQQQQQQAHAQHHEQQEHIQQQDDEEMNEEDAAYMMMMAEANAAAEEEEGQAGASDNGSRSVLQEAIDNQCTLFVGGLNWWTTDAEVEAACAAFGPLQAVRFLEERATGKSKGVAVVEFGEPEAAARCKEQLQGQEVSGCKVLLKWAGQFASGHAGARANGMAMRAGPLPPGAFPMNGMAGRGPGRGGVAGGRAAGAMMAGRGRGGRFEGMHPMMAMHAAGMAMPMMPGMPHPAMLGSAGMMAAMPPFAMAPGMMQGAPGANMGRQDFY